MRWGTRSSSARRSTQTPFSCRCRRGGRCSIRSPRTFKEKALAPIRDVMPAFEILQPSSIADAQQALQRHGADAWVISGGVASLDWLKDPIQKAKSPAALNGSEE